MKVSFITYHDEDNYGATLQAYATYKAIEFLGYEPEVINLHLPRRFGLLTRVLFSLKRMRFNEFRTKYLPNKTKVYRSLTDLQLEPPKSDVYLVGSDQTWNPSISKENALAYFLDFGSDKTKRISYASSFGTSQWIDSVYVNTEKVNQLLSRFSKVLVRESRAIDICRENFGVEAQQVVDPVLLFSSYLELTGEISEKKDTIVIYKILNDLEFYKKAKLIGVNLNCRVESVGSMRQIKGVSTHYPERIEKWISNIGTAKFVFTDSFHGTVLSLLYQRQFVVYVGDPLKISRITSILSLVGLSERICTHQDSVDKIIRLLETPIEYKRVNEILNEQRNISMMLLKAAILS